MIFSRTADLVMAGAKTQTTRLPPLRYNVGQTYAVQPGRGKFTIGRIRITGAELKPVKEQLNNWREEGFPGPIAFLQTLCSLYPHLHPDSEVAVYTFEVAP